MDAQALHGELSTCPVLETPVLRALFALWDEAGQSEFGGMSNLSREAADPGRSQNVPFPLGGDMWRGEFFGLDNDLYTWGVLCCWTDGGRA